MKKMVFGFCLLLGATTFASVDNVVISFSTQGPDTYADGAAVLDGECYALVWTPTGAEFGGVGADGQAIAPSVVALRAPVAAGGCCPPVKFEIDEAYAKAKYPGGSWCVCLLDTRKFAVDPVTRVIDRTKVESVGRANVVRGYGVIATPTVAKGTPASAFAPDAAQVVKAGEIPESGKALKVTDIAIEGNFVKLTVEGSLSCLAYGVKSGEQPGALAVDEQAGERYGETDGKLIIYTPKRSGRRFFGVFGK